MAKSALTACYGLAVVASGLFRYFSEEGGDKGLWFGIVMGTSALVAAWLMRTRIAPAGTLIAWLVVAMVGGWFIYESFFKKGFAQGDLRMYVVIGISVAEAFVLLRRSSSDATPKPS